MIQVETILIIIGTLTILDIILAIKKPKGMLNFLTKKLKSKSAWMIPALIFIVFLLFGCLFLQRWTVLQLIPGLFLGVLLTKMIITTYPKEVIPLVKKMYTKTDWFMVAIDLALIVLIFILLI